jgi:transcriptional regulator with XRE-family HTH domain
MAKPSANGGDRGPFISSGASLKDHPEKLPLTLSQVAHLTGIATSSLSDYEGGKIVPQVHQLKNSASKRCLTC